jgi:hypothetical protein
VHLLTHPAALTLYTDAGLLAVGVFIAAFLGRDRTDPRPNPTVLLIVQFIAIITVPVLGAGLLFTARGVYDGTLPLPDALTWLDGFARTGWEGITGVVEHLPQPA